MADKKEKLSSKDKNQQLALQKRYGKRITIAKQGREAFIAKDYTTAIAKYNEYLNILAESKNVTDIFHLSPGMFDTKTQITELLLISHIYWEVARINEMAPKLQLNFQRALAQFVKFSVNQPYQVLNSEMLRKYIKKNKNTSKQIAFLNDANSSIYVQSKKCYIATHCFGDQHPVTKQLRVFKRELLEWPFGIELVRLYYKFSSRFVAYLDLHFLQSKLLLIFSRPILSTFSKLTESSIFKRCSYFLKLLPKSGSKH